jgi:hypothetical protein
MHTHSGILEEHKDSSDKPRESRMDPLEGNRMESRIDPSEVSFPNIEDLF